MLHSLGGRGYAQQQRGNGGGYDQQGADDGELSLMSHLMIHPEDQYAGMQAYGRLGYPEGGGGRAGGGDYINDPSLGMSGGGQGFGGINAQGMRMQGPQDAARGGSRLFERAAPQASQGGARYADNAQGTSTEAKPAAVMGLVALGFNEASAREALFVCANNFDRAYEFLLGQQGPTSVLLVPPRCQLSLHFLRHEHHETTPLGQTLISLPPPAPVHPRGSPPPPPAPPPLPVTLPLL